MKLLTFISIIVFSANIGGHSSPATELATRQELNATLYEDTSRSVARFSKQAGLISLRSLRLADSATEMRIWKGGGTLYPRCFILKTQNQNRRAYLVAPKVVNNRVVYRSPHQVIYERTNLGNPGSGWESIVSYLKATEIDSPIGLALDKTYEPDPDEEMLALEVKSGRRYRLLFYLDSTKSQDGKKVFEMCRRIEREFAKSLGCGN